MLFLLGDRLVASANLKAFSPDRISVDGLLDHPQPDAPDHASDALNIELRAMANWLKLDEVRIG